MAFFAVLAGIIAGILPALFERDRQTWQLVLAMSLVTIAAVLAAFADSR